MSLLNVDYAADENGFFAGQTCPTEMRQPDLVSIRRTSEAVQGRNTVTQPVVLASSTRWSDRTCGSTYLFRLHIICSYRSAQWKYMAKNTHMTPHFRLRSFAYRELTISESE
jgi:hypothetical protein